MIPRVSKLPREMLMEIFLFVPFDKMVPLFLTSQQFHDILSSNFFWRLKCQTNQKLMDYLNQFLKVSKEKENSEDEDVEIDWKRCFSEYYHVCDYLKTGEDKGIGIDTNDEFSIDGYRHRSFSSDYGNVSFSRGKYRRGKWCFEMKIKRRSSAIGFGFCDPDMNVNTDVEYRPGYFGFYHGGISRMYVSFAKRTKMRYESEKGMMVGDEMGVMVDLDNFLCLAYFIKRRSDNGKKVRKVYYFSNLSEEAKINHQRNQYRISALEENSDESWYGNVMEKKSIVVSCHIWFYRAKEEIAFNYPAPVTKEYMDSFKLTKEEDAMFQDIDDLVDFSEEFFQ